MSKEKKIKQDAAAVAVIDDNAESKKIKKKRQRDDSPKERLTWKRVLKTVIPLFIVIILIVVILSVAFGNPDDISFSQDSIVATDVSPTDTSKGINGQVLSDSGLTEFANNGKLSLQYSPKDDLFVIQDLNTGRTFRSYPEPLHEDGTGSSDLSIFSTSVETGQIVKSPIFIGYTKSGLEGGFVKGINQMTGVVKSIYFIENGLRLRYEVGELELEFSVEITINDNMLKYKVPRNGIIERETLVGEEEDRRPLLTSLSILPYLAAHRTGDNGYYVTPDGSGAITRFDVARVTNYNEYSKRIYGIDPTFDMLDAPDYSNEALSMGVYGVIENEYMLTSFITQGESVAMLKMGNPGVKNLPFYNIYYQYNYRYFYTMYMGGSAYNLVVPEMQIGDVEQCIYFDSDNEFTYSEEEETAYTYFDVATKARTLILDKWNTKWGIDKQLLAETDSSMNIRFFMGAESVTGGVLGQMQVATSFEEVREIYEELAASGATDLKLTLLGWTKDGYYWNSTTSNKVERDFGGKSDLRDLTAWARQNNIELALDNNLLIIYGSPSGLSGASLRNSVVKSPDTYYLDYRSNNVSGRFWYHGFYMSPEYFRKNLLDESVERLESYGTDNVVLQQLGNLVYTDYNEENAILRVQAVSNYVDWLKKYQETFDNVSVYYGYDYAAAVADTIVDIPMSKSWHVLLDEAIPFMQIVYHGMVDYYSSPNNNKDDTARAILKSIEYGANISYEVTNQPTNILQYTNYLFLYKSEFSLLKEEIVAAYKSAEEAIKPFATQQITGHSRVADDVEVFCTEYSGGGSVYVNYTSSEYTLPNGSTVGAMSYLVVNG